MVSFGRAFDTHTEHQYASTYTALSLEATRFAQAGPNRARAVCGHYAITRRRCPNRLSDLSLSHRPGLAQDPLPTAALPRQLL